MPSPTDYTDRREAYCAWLTANNIDPKTVPIDGDITIAESDGQRHIHYEAYDLDAEGRKQLDERHQRSVPLIVEPPEWWEPYEKPTRDDLLSILGKVQQLAERWKHTADRKNGPRQELLAALGEHAIPEAP